MTFNIAWRECSEPRLDTRESPGRLLGRDASVTSLLRSRLRDNLLHRDEDYEESAAIDAFDWAKARSCSEARCRREWESKDMVARNGHSTACSLTAWAVYLRHSRQISNPPHPLIHSLSRPSSASKIKCKPKPRVCRRCRLKCPGGPQCQSLLSNRAFRSQQATSMTSSGSATAKLSCPAAGVAPSSSCREFHTCSYTAQRFRRGNRRGWEDPVVCCESLDESEDPSRS